jgi:hypothetical protein
MLAAIDHRDTVAQEVNFSLIESAITRDACTLLVLQFIGFCESLPIRGCALEIFSKQVRHDAIIKAYSLRPLPFHIDDVLGGFVIS